MTIKKYLTTPEEILALKDSDTKIYKDNATGEYHQFIGGVLCRIFSNSTPIFNAGIDVNGKYYILVEEPVKDADENDIGKLCKFWSDDPNQYTIGILYQVEEEDGCPYCVDSCYGCWYEHCHPLSPAEVAEITGYKVED